MCVWLVWTPVHSVQYAANMIDVITNAKGAFDVFGHT